MGREAKSKRWVGGGCVENGSPHRLCDFRMEMGVGGFYALLPGWVQGPAYFRVGIRRHRRVFGMCWGWVNFD